MLMGFITVLVFELIILSAFAILYLAFRIYYGLKSEEGEIAVREISPEELKEIMDLIEND